MACLLPAKLDQLAGAVLARGPRRMGAQMPGQSENNESNDVEVAQSTPNVQPAAGDPASTGHPTSNNEAAEPEAWDGTFVSQYAPVDEFTSFAASSPAPSPSEPPPTASRRWAGRVKRLFSLNDRNAN
jgi:hypothetical protein